MSIPRDAVRFEEGPDRNKALAIWSGGGGSYDRVGALTVTAALVTCVYAVVKAPRAGWLSARTLGLLGLTVLLVLLFVGIGRRSAAPLVPLRPLRSRSVIGGNLVVVLLGACAVAGAVAALTGVGERESGVASGINTAAFQSGGAFGVAVVTSVALSHTSGAEPLAALAGGYRAAFTACAVLAVAGLVCALVLLRGPRRRSGRPGADVTATGPPPPSGSARTAPPSPRPAPERPTADGP
jgi:hypothetical protein